MAEGSQALKIDKTQLNRYCERIEALKRDLATAQGELREAIGEVFAEAEKAGIDRKGLKNVLKLRAMSEDDRAILDTYADALGLRVQLDLDLRGGHARKEATYKAPVAVQ